MKPLGQCPSRIMIVCDSVTYQDERTGFPLSGADGKELAKLLSEVGINFQQCFTTAFIKHYALDYSGLFPAKKKDITPYHVQEYGRWISTDVRRYLTQLRQEIALCRPSVIIALGDFALWALTGEKGIYKWRGSTLEYKENPEIQILPTFTPKLLFKNWELRPIISQDFRRIKHFPMKAPQYKFITAPSYQEVMHQLNELYTIASDTTTWLNPLKLAVDIETRNHNISCLGIAWGQTEAMCIPFMCIDNPEGYWSENEESTIVFALSQLLTHPAVEIVGQNFLYDIQYIYRYWHFQPRLKRDTMLSQHVIFPELPKGLDFLSSMYAQYHRYWKDEGKEIAVENKENWEYNCKDCCITYEVDSALQRIVVDLGLTAVHDFQQELFWPVFRMMTRGIRPDFKQKEIVRQELEWAIAENEQFITDILGEPLNINSSPQMKSLFYEEFSLPPQKNRKTGALSCDDEALHVLKEKEPLLIPLIDKISETRSLRVFLSTFVHNLKAERDRIFCYFNPGGTETFRFSSSKNAFGSGLNLQNIPKGDK